MKKNEKMLVPNIIKKHWFLWGVGVSILAAKCNPEFGITGGPLVPELTVKYVAVSTIFFISGISLRSQDLSGALWQFRIHLFVQFFTFVFVPIFMWILVKGLGFLQINPWTLKGLLTVACMPPPVSSAVILTKAAGGNEAAAIFNSAFGSFIGVIITPLALLFVIGLTPTGNPLRATFTQLSVTVIIPLIVGQCLRPFISRSSRHLPFSAVGQVMLLYIIYTTFCDTFQRQDLEIDITDVLISGLLVILIQLFLLWMTYRVCLRYKSKYSNSDIVAIMFCSTHKSLTLGIPILKIVFGGYEHLSYISLPLLIYHPTQILLGGLLVPNLRHWIQKSSQSMPSLV